MWKIYLLILALAVGIFFYFRNPRNLKKAMPFFRKIWDFVFPDDWQENLDSLEYKKIKALNQVGSISKMLLLQAYQKIDKDFGFFYLITGRIGVGLELNGSSIISEKSIKEIQGVLDSIDIKDVAVQIITYASSDIDFYLKGIDEACSCDSKIGNIENLELMKEERIRKTKQWAKKSMLSEESGADLRARNFINMIIFIFPPETKLRKIRSFTNTVRGILESFSPRLLAPSLVAKIYGEILREDASLKDYDIHKKMNVQLAKNAHVRIDRENGLLRIGKKTYAKVLTTDKYPVHTNSFEVGNAFFAVEGEYQIPVATPFLASLTIHIDNPKKLKEKVLNKARWNIGQVKKIKDEDLVKFPNLASTINECKEVINYIEKEDQTPYEAMFSITVFDDNQDNLEQSIGRLKTKFKAIRTGGWEIAEEKFGLISYQSLLWSLPFQFDLETKDHLKRFDLMFNSNITSIVPIISSFKGMGYPILRFFARTGQVVGIDFWAGRENYNVCVIGPSGSGKSFLSNSIQASHLQAGVKVTIFDKGRSYLPLCQELGGEFIDFAKTDEKGNKNVKCLNFFTNIQTVLKDPEEFGGDRIVLNYSSFRISDLLREDGKIETIEEDSFQALVLIIGIMCGQDYSSGIKTEAGHSDNSSKSIMQTMIEEALMSAFYKKGREAGMREVAEALTQFAEVASKNGDEKISESLKQLVVSLTAFASQSGKFFDYFNGACNISLENDFTLLELDDLTNKGNLYHLVVMSMLERCAADMYFDRTKKKSIVVDEAADALSDIIYAKYFADFCRRVRKYGGSMMTITQNVRDYTANTYSEAVWTNSSHKMLLRLNPNEIAKGFESGGLFSGYSELTKMQMGSVSNRAPEYSEFLYIGDGGFSEVLLLKATSQEASMFTTNPLEQKQKKELQQQYGLTPQQATGLFGYLKEGIEVDEGLKLIKERNKSGTAEFWMNKIRAAFNNNSIVPYAQKVCDEKGNIIYYETFMRIIDDENIYTPKDFLQTAIEQELLGMIFQVHLKKCIEYFKSISQKFSINLHVSQINIHLLETLSEAIGEDEESKKLLILEVEAKNINQKEVFNFCVKAKESGFLVALDNIDFKIRLTDLETLRPDFIKISGVLIENAYSSENDRKKVFIFSELGKSFDILTIANHIENQKLYLMSKDIGIDFFQGFYFENPQNIFEIPKEEVKDV